jgi:hypothetical protein
MKLEESIKIEDEKMKKELSVILGKLDGVRLLLIDLAIEKGRLKDELWSTIYKKYPHLEKMNVSLNSSDMTIVQDEETSIDSILKMISDTGKREVH